MKLLYTIPVLALLNIGCSKEAAPEEEAAKAKKKKLLFLIIG